MNATHSWCRAGLGALLAIGAMWSWCVLDAAVAAGFPPVATAAEPAPPAFAVAVMPEPQPAPADPVQRSAAAPPIPAPTRVGPVHVYGLVLRSGAAVGGTELSFLAARDAWRERAVDWTITDASGRYEVELPPDCYLVELQDTGQHAATVLVRADAAEQSVDLVLPDPISAPSRASRGAVVRR